MSRLSRGSRGSNPNLGYLVASIGFDQVGDQDADNQGSLEAFPEPDQQIREHFHLSQPSIIWVLND